MTDPIAAPPGMGSVHGRSMISISGIRRMLDAITWPVAVAIGVTFNDRKRRPKIPANAGECTGEAKRLGHDIPAQIAHGIRSDHRGHASEADDDALYLVRRHPISAT